MRPAVFALVGALLVSGCRREPPTIVPPIPSAVRVSELKRTVDGLLDDPALSHGTWGIVVRSLTRMDTLYELNPRKLLMPASTMKLLTLGAAADRLGWDFRYQTRVLRTGTVDDGVLKGDLLIEGSGDPTLDDWDGAATKVFDGWADVLKQAGIRSVAGRIIGDDNAFDDDGLGSGWGWDDLGNSYATSVGALQFNENTAQLVITPGLNTGDRPSVEVRPAAAGLSVRMTARTSEAGVPAAIVVRPVPRSTTLEVRGSIPAGPTPLVRNVSVPDPTAYYVEAVREALVRNGIQVSGPAVDVDNLDAPPDRTNATVVAETSSPPLSEMASTMMKLSQNLFAETLLKTIGARQATNGSVEGGRSVVGGLLTAWGIPAGDVVMIDGSGLSRYNLMTPEAIASVLAHVHQDERLRDVFVQSLPQAGTEGTLSARMKGTPAAGNVRAKTGSFSNARAIAGYVQSANKEPLAFVIVANNYGIDPHAVDAVADGIVVALSQFSR